jgi:hypothetical protein
VAIPHTSPKQGLASLPRAGSPGSYARNDNLVPRPFSVGTGPDSGHRNTVCEGYHGHVGATLAVLATLVATPGREIVRIENKQEM